MQKKTHNHTYYYFLELIIVMGGFFLVSSLKSSMYLQLTLLGGLLLAYIGMGLIHHKVHHDLKHKIVIEYVVIALLVFSVFVFLNSGRL